VLCTRFLQWTFCPIYTHATSLRLHPQAASESAVAPHNTTPREGQLGATGRQTDSRPPRRNRRGPRPAVAMACPMRGFLVVLSVLAAIFSPLISSAPSERTEEPGATSSSRVGRLATFAWEAFTGAYLWRLATTTMKRKTIDTSR